IYIYIYIYIYTHTHQSFGCLAPISIETGNTVFSSPVPRGFVARYVSGRSHDISYTQSKSCSLPRPRQASCTRDSVAYYVGHIVSSHVVVLWLNVQYFLPPSRGRERERER
ncbi:unnamed protein product, partial [Musa textilis]